jgi:bifunctional UDP-N-acetylglucosamine pyrophosphorylase/glucosamine-1-phosphate N-acetyltransferase
MQAVILAAGKGTRMRPLTYDIPKPMIPLGGKPILEYGLSFLPEEVDEIILVINYLGDQIRERFGNEFEGKPIRYVVHDALDGTGGAIHACRDILEDRFLVLMGDDLYHKKDLEKLCQEKLALLAFAVDDPTRFGVLQMDGEGNLSEIIEKPKTKENRMANIGAYCLNSEFFNYPLVSVSEAEYGLPQTMAQMKDKHKIKIISASHWQPVGRPEDISTAEINLSNFLT